VKPWHDGYLGYYAALVVGFSPLLGVGRVLECFAFGLMFEAALRLRWEARA
jgi:hypothetical protein